MIADDGVIKLLRGIEEELAQPLFDSHVNRFYERSS